MESKEKLELLQTAIKQLIEDEKKESSSSVNSFVTVVKDGDEVDDDNRRLLSKLLSQLESLEVDGVLGEQSTDEKVPSPKVAEQHKGTNEACIRSSEGGKEEIVKELKKVRRQNLVTHCLLSVMIILTIAWQLSEVSLLLKVKEGLSHPFKSIGGVVKGMLNRPGINRQQGVEKPASARENPIIQAAALPGLKIPELPHVEFPSFDFESDED